MNSQNIHPKNDKYHIEIESYLAEVHAKADKIIDKFVLGFFIFGLLLAPIYDTWAFSLATGSLTVLMYALARFVIKNKFHARMIISLVFAVFMLQYIGQMHGMAELHFLFFTNITILIIYQDWRVIAPYTLAAVVHHSVLAFFQWYFGESANLGQYFITYSSISFLQLGFHFGLVAFMGVICGWWAIILRDNSITMLKAQLIAQEKTEIALASEEEIRQNLEELHTIQEKLIATQEEERKSNEVFKALFDYSTNPHLLFDETGIIDCNNATLSLLGYSSKNDLLKLHPAKLSPEKQNDGSLSSEKAIEMDKIAREKGYHRFEWTHHKADNTDFPVEVTLNPIKLGNKEVLLVVWNDLTERKQAELRIQQQNEKLLDSAEELRQNLEELNATQEALQNNSLKLEGQLKAIDNAIGYVEFTPDRKIATANKLFCNLLGYNEDEIKTLLHSDFLPKEYANSESYQEFWNTLLQGQSFTQEFERINKQGNTVWLYASYAPIVNKKGEVVRIIKLASDITERKQIDEKVKVQNDDLIAKNKEIAESHQKLKASEEEIRQNMEELVSTQEQLQAQYDLLAIKSKNISDSINYAQRIQTALLPRLEEIQSIFPDSFLLFRPRDVISGDFYWFANKTEENTQIIVAADCTGHGVPGAFMSMLGSSLLSNIVHDREIHEPNKILDLLHDNVEIMLNQRQEDSTNRDGMDASICVIDRNTNLIKYAGANNSLYIISQNPLNFVEKDETEAKITIIESENWQLTELKADKKSIGGRVIKKDNLNYNLQELQLNQELRIYLSSDGFIDQIGGAYRKKLMSKNFKQLLIENHQKPYEEQKTFFNTFFENWISDTEKQLDDVMVLGIKIIK